MEKTSPESSSFSLTDCFISFLLHCMTGCTELYDGFHSFFQLLVCSSSFKVTCCRKKTSRDFETDERTKKGDVRMRREEVEMVMGKVGIVSDPNECLDSGDLSVLFDEEEPSLGELQEAFCVFDENGDGFIDPRELQRVLCNLGFREGSNIYACKQMIAAFNRKGDGQIDFNDFVKLMEKSFC